MPVKRPLKRPNFISDKPESRNFKWPLVSELIPPLSESACAILEALPKALEQVWPLAKNHRRQLPADIAALSAILTHDRAAIANHYWQSPAYVSAYLYYFFPWNLIRFCRLLEGLDLTPPETKESALPLLLDAGSGPLTLPLALWISKPAWRTLPLHVFALDAAKRPLQLGSALGAAIAKITNQPFWQLTTATGSLTSLAKLAPRQDQTGRPLFPWLLTAANVLNELAPLRKQHGGPEAEQDAAAQDERFELLLQAWEAIWQTGAPILIMEPGTRLGGSTIMRLRQAALELGLFPQAPCAHNNPCPLLQSGPSSLSSSWCHFIFSALDAPEWLKELSRKAGLFKKSLTLSPLLLATQKEKAVYPKGALPGRVISQPFLTPYGKSSRYACAKCGLALLPEAKAAFSGSLCLGKPVEPRRQDKKTGAVIFEPFQETPDLKSRPNN